MTEPDRVAIVTGTSSGIGAALTRALLSSGWNVVGLARRFPDFESPHYEHLEIDLGDVAGLKTLAETRIVPLLRRSRWKRVGLVNNAAMEGGMHGVEHSDPLRLVRVLTVNAVAPIFLMGLAARKAPAAAHLRIVNLSSGAATRALPGTGEYGASKAALRLAGMVLAAELESAERAGGPRPRAAILSYEPGIVDTDMQRRARSSARDAPWARIFVDFAERNLLQPPDAVVGEITDFLAGDDPEGFAERRFAAS